MGILDIVRRGINPDGVGTDTARTVNNKKAIDILTTEDVMDKFIHQDAANDHETNRLVHVMFKQIRQGNAEVRTQVELYLDQWAFQHGGITKANYKEACRSLMRYATHILKRVNARREADEMRELEGSLGDGFDGESFGDLPGDGDFRKAIERYNKKAK